MILSDIEDTRLNYDSSLINVPIELISDLHPYYSYLWAAVMHLQPKNVVELGTYKGVSARVILDALPQDSRFTTVDIKNEAEYLENISDPRLSIVIGNSVDVVGQFEEIDFLFLDTDHSYVTISKEWELYKPKLSTKAFVLFDDIKLNDEMERFWGGLNEDKYDISQYHASGFGAVLIGEFE